MGGTQVEIHWLFALLLLLAAVTGFHTEAIILVGSLLAHEISHLAVAWVLGVSVERLVLTPFGGMARMDQALEADPQAEALVALAGPFGSFFLAGLVLFLTGDQIWEQRPFLFAFEANANLAFFNLVPALPLDGGRAMRGLLAQRWGHRDVTRWMVLLGRICGVVMALAALYVLARYQVMFWTPLVGGLFLWLMAGREASGGTVRSYRQFLQKQERLLQRRIFPAQTLVVRIGVQLKEVVAELSARQYHVVLVVDERLHPRGMVTEGELLAAFLERGPEVVIDELLGD